MKNVLKSELEIEKIMHYKLTPIKLYSNLHFKSVTLTHESGDVSVGFIFETQGRASETISIKWNVGPFRDKYHSIVINYRKPYEPMIVEDIGILQIIEEA